MSILKNNNQPIMIHSINLNLNHYLLLSLIINIYYEIVASSTIPVRPSTGRATLIPGQPLHFQCETVGNKDAQFIW